MDHPALAVLVMLNNWFHDFAVATLSCSLILLSRLPYGGEQIARSVEHRHACSRREWWQLIDTMGGEIEFFNADREDS